MSEAQRTVKIILLGDGSVGKTSLTLTYVTGRLPVGYIPSLSPSFMQISGPWNAQLATRANPIHDTFYQCCVDNCVKDKTIDSTSYAISVWDLGGGEDFHRLRPLSYPNTDVFFLCFSIASPSSLESVSSEWCPEVRHHCPNTPIMLVGTKLDLRNDENVITSLRSRGLSPVTTEQALEVKEEIGAWSYVECSSITKENLEYLFDEALQFAIVTAPLPKKKKCAIL